MMIDIIQEADDRTNGVFLKGNIQKVNDFPFDKVYFGATTKMTNPMEIDGPPFVSPYPGIASIFAVRPKKDALANKYNIPVEKVTSRDYDKWRQKFKDELMKGPVKDLTVIIGGVDFQPIKDTVTGYLHEITLTDELRDHIYKSDRMNSGFEFCLYKLSKVPFSKITNVTVNMTIVSKDQYMNKPVKESVMFDDITDDVFVESTANFDSTMKACKELHEAWSKFDYGIPIDGKIKNVPSAEYFEKNYRFLSPEDFEKYGGGVCWDFVEWGAKFLRDRGIQFHQYYIQTDTPPNYDTHTFLLCKCGKQYIYPESAFGIVDRDMGGVGVFDKLKDVVEYITSMMFECNGNKSRFKEFKYSVQEFYRVPAYGSTCGEYMDFMKNNARLVLSGTAYPRDDLKNNDGSITENSRIERVNDKGVPVPEKCPECGADVGIFCKGEPVWLCKKCHKYFGTVPCNIQESKLPASKRKKLKDSDFGIPKKRTFPLNDRAHVEAAVRMFPHADNKDKEQLAKRILRKAHELGIDTSGWDSINKFVQESFDEVSVEVPYATATAGVKVPEVEKTEINPFVSFDKVPLNDYIIDRYKNKTDDMVLGLKHLHLPEESIGFLWLNQNDDVVGYVATNKADIIGIELSPKYQHKGLGRALLDFATDYLGGRMIAVSKHNENAYNMLNHCGWCKYDETPNMNMLMIGEDVPDDHIQEAALLPSGVTLRPATDADIPRITTYTLDELAPEFRENKSIVDEVKMNAVAAVKKTQIIMYNGEVAGMRTGFYVKGGYWYIGIHLEERYRGKGIGTAILKREISRHDKLSLDVFKTNIGAIKLYKSLGFKVVHETEYAYAMTLEKNNKESDLNAT